MPKILWFKMFNKDIKKYMENIEKKNKENIKDKSDNKCNDKCNEKWENFIKFNNDIFF